jgi:hypothetical protein
VFLNGDVFGCVFSFRSCRREAVEEFKYGWNDTFLASFEMKFQKGVEPFFVIGFPF